MKESIAKQLLKVCRECNELVEQDIANNCSYLGLSLQIEKIMEEFIEKEKKYQ